MHLDHTSCIGVQARTARFMYHKAHLGDSQDTNWLNLLVGENVAQAWQGADAAQKQAAMHAACDACSLLMSNSELSILWALPPH